MTREPFCPTREQSRVIEYEGSAFVSACPGAGKTRVLVERVRTLLKGPSNSKGVLVLSFTNAAVSELEGRLRREGLLPSPVFPHFLGTFDSFLWNFLFAPFGVPETREPPRLIPDKQKLEIQVSERLPRLPLTCFDPSTGELIPVEARRYGFHAGRNPSLTRAYTTAAGSVRDRLLQRGEVDFGDVRVLAARRLREEPFSSRLASALSGRFREAVVDEAHDCNPVDLEIVQWLRGASIATKVICDPHQAIYSFRGGVREELASFKESFDRRERLSMTGNFRSSSPICGAMVALRPADARGRVDRALGRYKDVATPIHLLAYPGKSVPATVGRSFRELVEAEGLELAKCPVLAATRHSGANAVGRPKTKITNHLVLRLAAAVTDFHFAFEVGNRVAALEEVHRVVLAIEGRLGGQTYHQYLVAEELEPDAWRPRMLELVRELRYEQALFTSPDAWHARAKALLAAYLPPDGPSIAQRLPRNAQLVDALAAAPTSSPPAKTIHAVKGMQFPAVCVVLTVATTKSILDYLQEGAPKSRAEEARKIYVAASRAERLLAFATPQSQSARLAAHLDAKGAPVSVTQL